MCIIFWTQSLEHHTLVLAANRDEFLGRPTSPAAWHDFTPSSPHFPTPTSTQRVLSGIDIEAGGTWLGVSLPSSSPPPSSHRKSLRFATLTNFTESLAPGPSRPSRGKLVKEFLETDASLEEYLERLRDELDEFAGFNLLVGEMRGEEMRVGYATNRDEDGERKKPRVLEKNGVRGVSNSTLKTVGLGEEEWPKVTSGCAAFREVVQREGSDDDELVAGLWDVLSTANPIPLTHRSHLRHTVLVRPVFLNPRIQLPPHPLPFPSTPSSHTPTSAPALDDLPEFGDHEREGVDGAHWYATRVQTLLLITRPPDKDSVPQVTFYERDAYVLGEDKTPRWSGTAPRRFVFEGGPLSS